MNFFEQKRTANLLDKRDKHIRYDYAKQEELVNAGGSIWQDAGEKLEGLHGKSFVEETEQLIPQETSRDHKHPCPAAI